MFVSNALLPSLLVLGLGSGSAVLLPHFPVKLGNVVDRVGITDMQMTCQRVIDNPIKESLGPQDAIDNVVIDDRKEEPADRACNDLLPCVIVQVDTMKERKERERVRIPDLDEDRRIDVISVW